MANKFRGKAGKLNIEIEQGATFNLPLVWKDENLDPIDITGYSAEMHIRDEIDTVTTIIELSTTNGRIVLDELEGAITCSIAATDTSMLDFTAGVYDLELTSPGVYVTRLLEGRVTLDKEVTR